MSVAALREAVGRRSPKRIQALGGGRHRSARPRPPASTPSRKSRPSAVNIKCGSTSMPPAYGGGLALLPECEWVKEGARDWRRGGLVRRRLIPTRYSLSSRSISALFMCATSRRGCGVSSRSVPEYLRGAMRPARRRSTTWITASSSAAVFVRLKAWMVSPKLFGTTGLASRIRDHLRLARMFATWVGEDARFELSAPVVMGVVCFRLKLPDDAE